jgi:hypothetical protein
VPIPSLENEFKSFLKKSDDDFPFLINFELSKHLSAFVAERLIFLKKIKKNA